MKILHTADWHLGKRLERFPRLEEQRAVLEEICRITETGSVDAVLIAGDIFDTFNPPVEAVDLFYKTVKRLADNGRRPVIAIAGNHDSPERFEAPDPLARECGIILLGYPDSHCAPFQLESGLAVTRSAAGFMEVTIPGVDYPLRLLTTPYANEARLRSSLGFTDSEAELRSLLMQRWSEHAAEFCDTAGVNMLLAHLFMIPQGENPPEEPEEEKPILHVGGAQVVFSNNLPAQLQYVALGHLHGKRRVSANPPAWYCSSPLAYSMSEADQQKFVLIVEAEPAAPAVVREIPLQAGRRCLRKTCYHIDEAVAWLQGNPAALVELTIVSGTYLNAEDRRRLNEVHDGIVAIIPQVALPGGKNSSAAPKIDLARNTESLFIDYFVHRHEQQPDQDILNLLREVLAAEEGE